MRQRLGSISSSKSHDCLLPAGAKADGARIGSTWRCTTCSHTVIKTATQWQPTTSSLVDEAWALDREGQGRQAQ
jgi:hypothetical protein